MKDSLSQRGQKAAPGKREGRMRFIVSCMSFIFCATIANAADTQKKSVSIDAFSLISSSPTSADIEIIGSNDGSQGGICLGVTPESADGTVRAIGFKPYVFPEGQNVHISVNLLSPPGEEPQQTDVLLVQVYQCNGQPVFLRARFDWRHIWKNSPANTNSNASPQNDGANAGNEWRFFYMNLTEENFAAEDALLENWNNPRKRDVNGEWKLATFRDALNMTINREDGKDWLKKVVQKWRAYNPKSTGAALAEANFWYEYAWFIRGGHTPCNCEDNTFTDPVAMKIFLERMKRAQNVLDISRSFSSNNPIWYELYLDVANDSRRDGKLIDKIYAEGVRKYPYYQRLYLIMAKHLAPKSGKIADWPRVDAIVNQAVATTSEIDGTSNYARLYAWIDDHQKFEFDIFQDGPASWPKMRESYRDLWARYPTLITLNKFAAYACRADDKDTYLEIRAKIGTNILLNLWPSNYSVDLCDRRYMKPL